ncbi:MAG: hypothetical protein AAFX99_25770, partial [Myxococcota bacterium]
MANRLLKLSTDLSDPDLMRILGDLKPIVEEHKPFIATKHANREEFVDGVLTDHATFEAQDRQTVKEQGEADQALADRTAFYDEARAHIRTLRNRIRLIARLLAKQEGGKKQARALLRDYGLTGNRSNLNRNSHLERALTTVADAHAQHGDILKAWGCDDAFVAKAAELIASRPEIARTLARERSEAEQATDRRDELEAKVVEGYNDILALIDVWGLSRARYLLRADSSWANACRPASPS